MMAAARPNTPASARDTGFYLPLESDPHELTYMQWPVMEETYGEHADLRRVQTVVARIARSVARFEPVVMLVAPAHQSAAQQSLGPEIKCLAIPADDLWCRDSGPTFVVSRTSGALAISDLGFNGWGNKQEHSNDGLIAERLADHLKLPRFRNALRGEGGGVEVDGAGTALAHESSWINPNRNKQDKASVERLMMDALGVEKILWAPGLKDEDITDYHIDTLARFVRPGLVAIQLGKRVDTHDPWSVAAHETYTQLKSARDAKGTPLEIVILPEPVKPRIRSDDFVSSYANYYVCNGAVIAPEFGDDKTDAEAQSILRQLYPGREVVSLNIDPLGEAGGGIHCATHEKPALKAR